MGKRSDFPREPRDLYRTWDKRAVTPLLSHLAPGTRFAEPMAGAGDLIDQLEAHGHTCVHATDIEPLRADVMRADAMSVPVGPCDVIITNPPWRRDWLHPLILTLCAQAPTWLLFDADWMHTVQSAPFMRYCVKIVAVGRVRWIEGSHADGKDNCVWYLFDLWHDGAPPAFYPRMAASTTARNRLTLSSPIVPPFVK